MIYSLLLALFGSKQELALTFITVLKTPSRHFRQLADRRLHVAHFALASAQLSTHAGSKGVGWKRTWHFLNAENAPFTDKQAPSPPLFLSHSVHDPSSSFNTSSGRRWSRQVRNSIVVVPRSLILSIWYSASCSSLSGPAHDRN